MTTFLLGVPRGEPTASTLRTTSMPSVTLPKTVCRPSNLDGVVVRRKKEGRRG